jgi:hypothetical protein
MKVRRRVGMGVAIAAAAILATPGLAGADLSINVPSSVDLGSVVGGTRTLSAPMGTVTVTASALAFPSYIARVSTSTFTTGSRSTAETVPQAAISYWSGPATLALLQNAVPGQATAAQAQSLSVQRTAFASSGLALSITTKWNPTIVIALPAAAVTGSYTGTITHSVA